MVAALFFFLEGGWNEARLRLWVVKKLPAVTQVGQDGTGWETFGRGSSLSIQSRFQSGQVCVSPVSVAAWPRLMLTLSDLVYTPQNAWPAARARPALCARAASFLLRMQRNPLWD